MLWNNKEKTMKLIKKAIDVFLLVLKRAIKITKRIFTFVHSTVEKCTNEVIADITCVVLAGYILFLIDVVIAKLAIVLAVLFLLFLTYSYVKESV